MIIVVELLVMLVRSFTSNQHNTEQPCDENQWDY